MIPLEGKGIYYTMRCIQDAVDLRPALEKAYFYSMSISRTRFCWRMIST